MAQRSLATAAERINALRRVGIDSPDYFDLIAKEPKATRLVIGSLDTVPGFLQTEECARAFVENSGRMFSPAKADALVGVRVARGDALLGAEQEGRLAIGVILGEVALHRQVAGAEAQAQQLGYLANIAEGWMEKAATRGEEAASSLVVVPLEKPPVMDSTTIVEGEWGEEIYVESRNFSGRRIGVAAQNSPLALNARADLAAAQEAALTPVESLELIMQLRDSLVE